MVVLMRAVDAQWPRKSFRIMNYETGLNTLQIVKCETKGKKLYIYIQIFTL